MANTLIEVKEWRFKLLEDKTVVQLLFTSSEPDNHIWGGGWKTKSFPITIPVVDLIPLALIDLDYLMWEWDKDLNDEAFFKSIELYSVENLMSLLENQFGLIPKK